MKWLLRLFGIRDPEPTWPVYKCPHCGHERSLGPPHQDPTDAYLAGASVEYLEAMTEANLRRGST
jgi:hypothetical protein